MRRKAARPTLFPYTTLFRSLRAQRLAWMKGGRLARGDPRRDKRDHEHRDWRHTQRHEIRRAHAVERSEEHTSELQSQSKLVCRLPLEKKKIGTTMSERVSRR